MEQKINKSQTKMRKSVTLAFCQLIITITSIAKLQVWTNIVNVIRQGAIIRDNTMSLLLCGQESSESC